MVHIFLRRIHLLQHPLIFPAINNQYTKILPRTLLLLFEVLVLLFSYHLFHPRRLSASMRNLIYFQACLISYKIIESFCHLVQKCLSRRHRGTEVFKFIDVRNCFAQSTIRVPIRFYLTTMPLCLCEKFIFFLNRIMLSSGRNYSFTSPCCSVLSESIII